MIHVEEVETTFVTVQRRHGNRDERDSGCEICWCAGSPVCLFCWVIACSTLGSLFSMKIVGGPKNDKRSGELTVLEIFTSTR